MTTFCTCLSFRRAQKRRVSETRRWMPLNKYIRRVVQSSSSFCAWKMKLMQKPQFLEWPLEAGYKTWEAIRQNIYSLTGWQRRCCTKRCHTAASKHLPTANWEAGKLGKVYRKPEIEKVCLQSKSFAFYFERQKTSISSLCHAFQFHWTVFVDKSIQATIVAGFW